MFLKVSASLISCLRKSARLKLLQGHVLTLVALSANVLLKKGASQFMCPIDKLRRLLSGSPTCGAILGIASRNNIVMGLC